MIDKAYKDWLFDLKNKVRNAQLKAAVAVNTELILLYWELGKMITEKQTAWGTKFLNQLSQDLRSEFPNMEGFSETNLKYCRLFFQYTLNSPQVEDYPENAIRPQAEDQLLLAIFKQIPWGHIKLIINKIKDTQAAIFYAQSTIESGLLTETYKLKRGNS
jgi:predicted nuclease of restriction endonuclease-like (RecB) superfamily